MSARSSDTFRTQILPNAVFLGGCEHEARFGEEEKAEGVRTAKKAPTYAW